MCSKVTFCVMYEAEEGERMSVLSLFKHDSHDRENYDGSKDFLTHCY